MKYIKSTSIFKNYSQFMLVAFIATSTCLISYGQDEAVTIEAESGILGADYKIGSDGDTNFVFIQTDLINSGNPGSADRLFMVEITFPDSGYYDFYAKMKVGLGGADDDSYFYANGFGTKDPLDDNDWIIVNNIGGLGFSNLDDYVYGDGGASNTLWKWLNFSSVTGQGTPVNFHVTANSLTQTFMIGGREDGFLIDKIAFGKSDFYYTVANLENGEGGTDEEPVIIIEIPTGPPLATNKCKFLGSAHSSYQAPYFERLWNQVIPENAGKWGDVEGVRDVMNWAEMDSAYALAKNNGFPFQFHVLVWGNQQPVWIESLEIAEQRAEIEEWFEAVATRYPDIDIVQVVNEPLHDPPAGEGNGNYIDALGGNGVSGWDWIVEAFTLAQQYFPDADLMINDYNIVGSSSNTDQYIGIIDLLLAENLIDAIGVQAHAFSTRGSASAMRSNLTKLGETGLPVYATEFDVDGLTNADHLSDYQRIFPVFWEHPSVKGVTLWGFRQVMWNVNDAYLLNSDGTERPSMTWLKEYVSSTDFDPSCLPITTDLQDSYLRIQNDNIIYPNPASNGRFTISGLKETNQVRILDINGKEIAEFSTHNQSSININLDVSPGIYFVQLSGGLGLSYKKLVIN